MYEDHPRGYVKTDNSQSTLLEKVTMIHHDTRNVTITCATSKSSGKMNFVSNVLFYICQGACLLSPLA